MRHECMSTLVQYGKVHAHRLHRKKIDLVVSSSRRLVVSSSRRLVVEEKEKKRKRAKEQKRKRKTREQKKTKKETEGMWCSRTLEY